MLPLFDLMMRAENGKAMEAFARQFNLAQDQAAKAVAALMPAFSEALKRQSANPFDFASLMQKAAGGNYQSYFEDLTRAFTPQGLADGQAALGQIFGSPDMAGAIAEQAAKLTGLGQDVLRQMMPAMADTMMGGLAKEMMGQMGQASMGAMADQWLETIGLKPKKKDPLTAQFEAQMQAMMDNPFTKAMQGWLKPEAKTEKAETSDPFSFNPFMKSFQEMMAAAASGAKPAADAKPQAAPETPEAYTSFVNTLFDSGLEVQKSYQASLEAIFDQWKPRG